MSKEMSMTTGSLFPKLIKFSIPLILSGILQLLFNAADIVVVGRYSGSNSLAAVGSTSSLINLLINLFMGLSIGASVLMGRYVGARDFENASKTVHSAMFISIFGGIFMLFVGVICSSPLLQLMDTPKEVLDLSVLYMRIYFLSMPAFAVFNFGASLLRAVGDTKTPLYFLTASGVINVILNLIFVIKFNMGVAGVASATAIAQYISAGLVVLSLMRSDDVLHLHLKDLKMDKQKVYEMMKIGLPAGVQGTIFSISNVLIQSSVNSFGPIVMAGNTAASNIEGFVYTSMNSIHQTALNFTSQNMGAKNYKRVDKILIECLLLVTIVGLVMGQGAYYFGHELLSIYNSDPEVIQFGLNRLALIAAPYFLCGLMDVAVGSLRGMGYSMAPMMVSIVGVCVFRVVWIYTIFAMHHTQFILYISYPISWTITFTIHLICFMALRKRIRKIQA